MVMALSLISRFDALDDLLRLTPGTTEKLCHELNLPCFTGNELLFLREYRSILEPVAIALDQLQGEDKCYFAFVLPALQKIKEKVQAIMGKDLKFARPIAQAVLDALEKRFGHLLNQDLDHDDLKKRKDVKEAVLATIRYAHSFIFLRSIS